MFFFFFYINGEIVFSNIFKYISGCSNKNKKQGTAFQMVEVKENCQTWSQVKSKGKKKQNRQCSGNVQTQDNTGKKKVTKEQKKQKGFLSNAFYLESESEEENKMDEPDNEKIDLTRFKISKVTHISISFNQ